jgi:hypothetical protein
MSRPLALTGPLGGPLGVPLLPCLADLCLPGWRYRAILEDSSHEQPDQEASKILTHLLNHLIRPLQERRRDRQAEGLGGLEVDDELQLRRLLDW